MFFLNVLIEDYISFAKSLIPQLWKVAYITNFIWVYCQYLQDLLRNVQHKYTALAYLIQFVLWNSTNVYCVHNYILPYITVNIGVKLHGLTLCMHACTPNEFVTIRLFLSPMRLWTSFLQVYDTKLLFELNEAFNYSDFTYGCHWFLYTHSHSL